VEVLYREVIMIRSFNSAEHTCSDCIKRGHCVIEPIANYFREHGEEEEFNANKKINKLLHSSWLTALMADAACMDKEEGMEFYFMIAVGTGYILGKGCPVPEVELDIEDALRALLAISSKRVNEDRPIGEN
jgi:hypothetical protein